MSGLATSGTLTHWFRDNLARDLDPATAMIALAAEAAAVATGRQGPRPSPLLLRRADADPRSACQGRALRPQPHPHPRRHLPGAARRHRLRHQPHRRDLRRGRAAIRSADLSPSAAAPRTRSGRRRPRTSRAARRSSARRPMGASYGDAFLAALAVGDVKPETSATGTRSRRSSRRSRQCRGLCPAISGLQGHLCAHARPDAPAGRWVS